jgi:glycosyl transferase family 25
MSQTNKIRAVNDCVEVVYVLSVKTLQTRIQSICQQLLHHDIQFEFIFDYDADDLRNKDLSNIFAESDLTLKHKSLVMKNIYAWQDAVNKNFQTILVFEDDALLSEDFVSRFDTAMAAANRLNPGWLIFLGGADVKVPDHYFLAEGPLVEMPISTAEGCVSDISAIRRRLNWLENNKITLPADHLIRHIDKQMGTSHYWLTTPIVEQGSTIGMFDSMLDSHRQKHSLTFTKWRNRWNKLRRQRIRRIIVRMLAKLGFYSKTH